MKIPEARNTAAPERLPVKSAAKEGHKEIKRSSEADRQVAAKATPQQKRELGTA